ncbi:protein pitchfork [Falco biarmicus]|uniref:protein pitchfork n=1 Tax=Falco cherrug TaxID=345164 RepID=UPI000392E321|nr:protein pitchfork [Falco cherrug]XP_037266759.1 protein pitchfork [Falco rusticolus]XP_056217824.1 protein pitchfork [Falco biarmicus]
MAAEWQRRDGRKRISFGSCQERKMFPLHHAPDRLAIQLIPIRGDPSLGPGCYLSHESGSLRYSLENKPLSKKGYVIGARTAQRFIPEPQTVTPSPATYQSFWNKEGKCQPAYAPFSTRTPRFPDKPSDKNFPGPGAYNADKPLHKKITWPMKFGSPDWSLVPMPAKRMLKMEVQKLTIDKELWKHRNRVAYLSLYYS